ncbi:MAG: ATP-binding cassette domain-containing protein [Acidiferrobacter sp.]
MRDAALIFQGVHKSFRRGDQRIEALRGVDAQVSTGTITGLLGPDGAGKTTLIRLATALLLPESGMVRILGADSRTASSATLGTVAYMPQRFGLYEDLTVQENLDLYANLQGLTPTERRQRYDELLRLTALGPFGKRRAGDLSGGMKQKLGLACALLRTPRLLLLDEPTVGVDPISRRELWTIIQGLKEKGVTILISTSYLDEADRCDDIILLHEGVLIAQQSPEAFRTPLAGHCYLVQAATVSRRQLQARLAVRAGVVDALVQAHGVRVIVSSASSNAAEGEDWQTVAPRFEDAFISRLHTTPTAVVPPTVPGSVPVAVAPVTTPAATPVIEVQNLRRFFGHFEAVKGISFSVSEGEIFGLLGANGAGKSTTFRMLCGLLPPSSGTLRVAGVDLRFAPATARGHIGYVSQKFSLYGNLSVAQNLVFFAAAYGLRGDRRAARLRWALEEFDLGRYTDVNSGDLPLGFKQRLALACTLLHEPPILFLDEPTSGVDPLARREFWQRINALAEGGVTVMVTTHFMEEAEYCDHLVLMSLGEILASGSPAEIRASAQSVENPMPSMEDAFITLIQSHEGQIRRAS